MEILKRIVGNPHPMNIGVRPHTWIDAADISTVTLNVNDVAQINDKSGNVHNFNQATAANQPDYTGILNGKKIITFNGTSEFLTSMEASSVWKFLSDGSPFSIACVAYVDNTGPTGTQPILSTGTTQSSLVGMDFRTVNSGGPIQAISFNITRGVTSNPVIGLVSNNGFTRDQWNLGAITFQYNVAGNDAKYYLNGAFFSGADSVNIPSSSNPATTLMMGYLTIGGWYLKGSIAEFIIYNTVLTPYQINILKIYLKAKWGL